MEDRSDVGEALYDEKGRPVGDGLSPERTEAIIFEGLTGLGEEELDRFGNEYDDFIDRFQGNYDLDDLLKDYGFSEILEEASHSEVELRESDEDMARYNLRAGVLTVEAEESGWKVNYEQDPRIEANLDVGIEGYRSEWAEILSDEEDSVSREGRFIADERIRVGQENHLPDTLRNIIEADELLAEISEMKPEYEISSQSV